MKSGRSGGCCAGPARSAQWHHDARSRLNELLRRRRRHGPAGRPPMLQRSAARWTGPGQATVAPCRPRAQGGTSFGFARTPGPPSAGPEASLMIRAMIMIRFTVTSMRNQCSNQSHDSESEFLTVFRRGAERPVGGADGSTETGSRPPWGYTRRLQSFGPTAQRVRKRHRLETGRGGLERDRTQRASAREN
jgi:hypothetical protein